MLSGVTSYPNTNSNVTPGPPYQHHVHTYNSDSEILSNLSESEIESSDKSSSQYVLIRSDQSCSSSQWTSDSQAADMHDETRKRLIYQCRVVCGLTVVYCLGVTVFATALAIEMNSIDMAAIAIGSILDAFGSILIYQRYSPNVRRYSTVQRDEELERKTINAIGITFLVSSTFIFTLSSIKLFVWGHRRYSKSQKRTLDRQSDLAADLSDRIAIPSSIVYSLLAIWKYQLSVGLNSNIMFQDFICSGFGAFMSVVVIVSNILEERMSSNSWLTDPMAGSIVSQLLFIQGVRILKDNWLPILIKEKRIQNQGLASGPGVQISELNGDVDSPRSESPETPTSCRSQQLDDRSVNSPSKRRQFINSTESVVKASIILNLPIGAFSCSSKPNYVIQFKDVDSAAQLKTNDSSMSGIIGKTATNNNVVDGPGTIVKSGESSTNSIQKLQASSGASVGDEIDIQNQEVSGTIRINSESNTNPNLKNDEKSNTKSQSESEYGTFIYNYKSKDVTSSSGDVQEDTSIKLNEVVVKKPI